jgi:nitrogen PTS system EIIA component
MPDTAPVMKIKSILAPESVALDLRASDKLQLLRELAQRAAPRAGISAETVLGGLMRREELGSTGIGAGVAIPHARFDGIKEPLAFAVRLKPPVAFDAIDGQPVDLVFLLLTSSSANSDHLNILAAVSRRLRDPGVLQQLRASKDAVTFYCTLTADGA